MGIVEENEIVCLISMKENGSITNVLYSSEIDEISTSNISLLSNRDNINPKVFLLNVSNFSDNANMFLKNQYIGISSIGSGENVEITLTFSKNISRFTINFDSISQSMPINLSINGNTIVNNDFYVTYNSDYPTQTFIIKINEMNTINNKKMPIMIVGISNIKIIEYKKSNGLKSIKTINKTRNNTTKILDYGIINCIGNVSFYDMENNIGELLNMGVLNSKSDITIKMGKGDNKSIIGKYISNKWTEEGYKNYSVSLTDNLISLQDVYPTDSIYGISTRKIINVISPYITEVTAFDIYTTLKTQTYQKTGINVVLNIKTRKYFEKITKKYLYLDGSLTLWENWNRFCELTQSYMFLNKNGDAQIISQYEINYLASIRSSNYNTQNPIIIPYNIIDEEPSVNRILDNVIDNYEILTKRVSGKNDWIYNSGIITYNPTNNYADNNAPTGATIVQVNGHKYMNFFAYPSVDGLISYKNYLANEKNENANEGNYIFYSHILEDDSGETGGSISLLPTSNSSIDDYQFPNVDYDDVTMLSQYQKINSTVLACHIQLTGITGQSGTYTKFEVGVKSDIYSIVDEIEQYGIGENKYSTNDNYMLDTETLISGEELASFNSKKIFADYNGRQTITFRCAMVNMYDARGNLKYNIDNGQFIQPFDLIQINGVDGNNKYGSILWQVSNIEFEKTGAKFLNISAFQIGELCTLEIPDNVNVSSYEIEMLQNAQYKVNVGDIININANKEGYNLTSLKVNNINIPNNSYYVITGNTNITALFEQNSYFINITDDNNKLQISRTYSEQGGNIGLLNNGDVVYENDIISISISDTNYKYNISNNGEYLGYYYSNSTFTVGTSDISINSYQRNWTNVLSSDFNATVKSTGHAVEYTINGIIANMPTRIYGSYVSKLINDLIKSGSFNGNELTVVENILGNINLVISNPDINNTIFIGVGNFFSGNLSTKVVITSLEQYV